MKIEILVAICTSITSIIVAIVSFLSVKATNNNARNLSIELENLKAKLESKKAFLKIPEEHLTKRIAALDMFIQEIQIAKDNISFIQQAEADMLSFNTAKELLTVSREKFLIVYESMSVSLHKQEQEATHKAKNIVFGLPNVILSENQSKYLELDTNRKEAFSEARAQLTDIQNILRDSKIHLITSLYDIS